MARDDTVTLTAGAWTQLTNGDVTNITFQNLGGYDMRVKGTVGAVAPSGSDGALFPPGEGKENATLSELFSGTSGANRVYAFCKEAIDVYVSHA